MADSKTSTILDLDTEISDALRDAHAVMDAARILGALERAPTMQSAATGMQTGQGYIEGNCAIDCTLHDLLELGRRRVRTAQELAEKLVDLASAAAKPKIAGGASNG